MSITDLDQHTNDTNGHDQQQQHQNGATDLNTSSDSPQQPPSNSVRVLIDSAHVGAIIGREGCNVKHVRQTTGCIVSIAKVDGQTNRRNDAPKPAINPRNIPERILTLRGDNNQIVDAARNILQLLVDANNAEAAAAEPLVQADSTLTFKLLVHKSIVGCIIGKEGSTIRQLQEDTHARIQISNQPLPASTDKSVSVTGSVDNIVSALTQILALLDANPLRDNTRTYPYQPTVAVTMVPYEHYNGMMYPPVFGQPPMYPPVNGHAEPAQTQKIAIPSACAGAIIGRSGRTIKDMRLRTGCIISIAEQDVNQPNERVVTLTGSTQSIHMAIIAIRSLVEQQAVNAQQEQHANGGMPQNGHMNGHMEVDPLQQ